MGASQNINSIFPVDQAELEKQQMISIIDQIAKAANNLNSNADFRRFAANFTTAKEGMKIFNDELTRLAGIQNDVVTQSKKVTDATLQEAKANTENAKAAKLNAEAAQALAKAKLDEAKAANENAKAQKLEAQSGKSQSSGGSTSSIPQTGTGQVSDGSSQAIQDQVKASIQAKEALRQQNLETKNLVIMEAAAEGSIQKMRAELNLLTGQYDKMGAAEREAAGGQELLQKIAGQSEALKKLEAETGRYQRNVGNYTGAIQVLEKSLQEVKNKIDQMTQSGKGNDQELQKLNKEYELLEQLVGKQAQGFTSLSREVMMTGKQLETLAEQGMQNTETFKNLEQVFADAKRELKEFQINQQLLTSPKAGLEAMTLTAKALGGTYALAAGGASLFADGNEKVEKELQKLVAIMTILQGLNEVHEFLEKKNAIATLARGAAEKIKAFIMTGSTIAVEAQE